MREAVIVSTARTPIGRAYRGAFNDTEGPTLAGHVVAEAVRRAGIEPAEVDDGMTVAVGGGVESVSLVQNDKRNQYRAQDPWLVGHRPDLYMTMIETAE